MKVMESIRNFGETKYLLSILGMGILFRLAAINAFTHIPESDELAYHSMALNLIRGHEIVDNLGNHAFYNSGYSLFILAPVFAIFGDNILVARFINAILSTIGIILCHMIAKEAGAGKAGRLLAALIWALYLPASVYTIYLFKENLMAPLMLGVMWCAIRMAKEPTSTVAIICGILFGLIALTGNAALSLALPVFFALMSSYATPIKKLVLTFVILGSTIPIVAPWVVRNVNVVGAPVLNTNGGFNLYLGNNPAATGMFISIADTPVGSNTWHKLLDHGEVYASDALKQKAITWIKENPTTFIFLALKKAALFWTPPLHEGINETSAAETAARAIWLAQFAGLLIISLSSLLLRKLWSRTFVLIWLAIGSYTAVHMLFYVIFRYREPIMPLLCVLTALAIEALWQQWELQRVSPSSG
jgi:4-amino-4-deoxy-L-arabinose transferase-like glycosyltransferase